MKIAAYLENKITVGGGFNQSLNAIIRIKEICKDNYDLHVFTPYKANLEILKKTGINASFLKFSLIDKAILISSKSLFLQSLQKKLNLISPFEKSLIAHNINLIYFLTQSSSPLILRNLNYITTVFDLCHRDMPEFPEAGSFYEFNAREHYFKTSLSRAILIITDSEKLSKSVSIKYGIDQHRLLAIPFSPSPFLNSKHSLDMALVLNFYGLEQGYFFYPAQFWAHKNHIRILEALVHLRNIGIQFNVVFVGSDHGNKQRILNFVTQNALEKQVSFLGFVPPEHMRGLYEGCLAVVMPTYFGPTNLPPLEAWLLGKPLIYSAHLKDQAGDAAIFVNPDNAKELAESMKMCTDTIICDNFVKAGYKRLEDIENQQIVSYRLFKEYLAQYVSRQKCWS